MKRKTETIQRRYGLTRLDVVFAIGVLTLLGLLLGPYVLKVREQARAATCRNNLRNWTTSLHNYHDVHKSLPPAANWSTMATHSLALHLSKRVEKVTHENWAISLLEYLPDASGQLEFDASQSIGTPANVSRERSFKLMKCGSDLYNRMDNPHVIQGRAQNREIRFARGNYAINGGTHNFSLEPPSTSRPQGDFVHLEIDSKSRSYQLWGNGIAGINKSFSYHDFENGLSTLVAIDEVRAGIHPADPRGVWALGQIGGSITWAHGVNGDAAGPNNQWSRSDDIMGCEKLHQLVGNETLKQEGMPCVNYVDINQQATSRSLHPRGVHVSFLDGRVKFLSDDIDPGLWHVLHSRETPPSVFKNGISFSTEELNSSANSKLPESTPRSKRKVHHKPSFVNSIGMTLAYITAGEFQMGLPDNGYSSSLPQDAPVHSVRLTNGFYLSTCEVTNEQFQNIVSNLSNVSSENGKYPVTNLTWEEANHFCERLNLRSDEKNSGRRYRLPTEAEWEYACRSGKSQPYRWEALRDTQDNSGEAAGISPPLPLTEVGAYPPNEFGLHDMRGNAWEWTADWYQRDYYLHSPRVNPMGPATGFFKVVRGSDWRFVGEKCFIDYPPLPPWKSNPVVGFRVVCEMKE